jgi:hypothetical protein
MMRPSICIARSSSACRYLTEFQQLQLVLAEDGKTVLIDAFYGDGDDSLTSEFTLPPELRGRPFNSEPYKELLLASFCVGTLH